MPLAQYCNQYFTVVTLWQGTNQNAAVKFLVTRQQKTKLTSKKPAKTVYVDLTAQKEEEEQDSEDSQEWIKIGTIKLSNADKDILLHPTAWLNDNIIHAAQLLLKKQAPVVGGLQEPGKGQVCAFDIERGEFIQIIHDGHGHWLMISTIGVKNDGEVHVYDSMYPSVGSYTKKQIASILCTEQSKIDVHMMDVQIQAGGSDWLICNRIHNSYCQWRSPWEVYIQSSGDEAASLPMFAEW